MIRDLRLGRYEDVLPEYAGVDAHLAILDLPYGISSTEWDTTVDLPTLWEILRTVLSKKSVSVAFAVQPFAGAVLNTNLGEFRYDLIWRKPNGTNPFQAKHRPMRNHENILVFASKGHYYEPQMSDGQPYVWDSQRSGGEVAKIRGGGRIENTGVRFPRSVLDFPQERGLHPTQKPVELCRWLIRSYCPPGGIVIDPTMGSGTSCLAAAMEERQFVGVEQDSDYHAIAIDRVSSHD